MMRILWFFGYVAGMIVVPVIVIGIAQIFIGPLQWPPPHGHTGRLPTSSEVTAVGLFTGAWVVAQLFVFGRMASWASTVGPGPGAAPVSATQLASRLLALNSLRAPWQVGTGRRPDELVVDWRYADATWLDSMRAHGLRRTFRLALRLDERNRVVRAIERHAELDWSAGVTLGAATLRWQTTYGINFHQHQHEGVFGLQIRNGQPTLDLSYAYTFSLKELKNPIIDLVTDAGWQFRPVITFFRPVGG
ncbi:hypothetical protein [Reyranella sp.]|uniref:hypothetical protein n=1 Tax=Reyranella sp. TaxID=1929291 RepID=UPI003D0ABFF4